MLKRNRTELIPILLITEIILTNRKTFPSPHLPHHSLALPLTTFTTSTLAFALESRQLFREVADDLFVSAPKISSVGRKRRDESRTSPATSSDSVSLVVQLAEVYLVVKTGR